VRAWIGAGFLAAALFSTSACYTLLEHPGIARRNYLRPSSDTPCTTCHARDALRAFLEPERLAREKGPWDRLNHPWWFDARAAADSAAADSARAGSGGGR
jgi:hypothetical protein